MALEFLEYLTDNTPSTFVPPPSNVELPGAVDWRSAGYVSEVKDQGHCGSCYSFAATGALEGQWFKKTGKLVSESEQQIIDCSFMYGNNGCHGGWYQSAWKYLKSYKAKGVESEAGYPYEARDDKDCRHKKAKSVATVRGFVDLIAGSEKNLQQALATIGPVAVAIDDKHLSFHRYQNGVYYNKNCGMTRKKLTHAVLAVGYGTEDGKDYWLVKNSWGSRWGLKGYFKMARNRDNNCGITLKASYPLV